MPCDSCQETRELSAAAASGLAHPTQERAPTPVPHALPLLWEASVLALLGESEARWLVAAAAGSEGDPRCRLQEASVCCVTLGELAVALWSLFMCRRGQWARRNWSWTQGRRGQRLQKPGLWWVGDQGQRQGQLERRWWRGPGFVPQSCPWACPSTILNLSSLIWREV